MEKRALIPILFFALLLPLTVPAHASALDDAKDVLKSVYDNTLGKLVDAINKLVEELKQIINMVIDAVKSFTNMIVTTVKSFVDALYTAISYPFVKLKEGILAFVDGVKSTFEHIASALGYAGSSLKDTINNAFTWLKNNIWVLPILAASLVAIRYAMVGWIDDED